MPLDDFKCEKCEHIFEEFYNYYNPPPTECPECKSSQIVKLISFSRNGKAELSGHELMAKTKEDLNKMRSRSNRDEKYLANIVGEGRFEKNQSGK